MKRIQYGGSCVEDSLLVCNIYTIIFCIGALRFWIECSNVDFEGATLVVWEDESVSASLDCAAFWINELPYSMSLSGYWNFFLVPNPEEAHWLLPKIFHFGEIAVCFYTLRRLIQHSMLG